MTEEFVMAPLWRLAEKTAAPGSGGPTAAAAGGWSGRWASGMAGACVERRTSLAWALAAGAVAVAGVGLLLWARRPSRGAGR